MTNLTSISPIDRARMGNTDILSRLSDIEAIVRQIKDISAQSLSEVSTDVWGANASFPSICQGRLTTVSGNPTPQSNGGQTVYFTPYKGNLIGLYDLSQWNAIPFSELSIPLLQSQSGGTHNGTAVIDGLTDTSQLVVGMWVSGTGIPVTATILSIDSATQITMDTNSTASATVTVTFTVPQGKDLDFYVIDTGFGVLALRMVFWSARQTGAITGVTNAAPMVVSSAALAPSLTAGDIVTIRNVAGATGANGRWRVGTVTATTFQLLNYDGTNTAAGGVYTSGGTAQADSSGSVVSRVTSNDLQDGIYVKSTDHTWRYVGSAHWTYGGITSGAIGSLTLAVSDTYQQRNLWNYYNRLQRPMFTADASASWNVSAINTWKADHNNITSSRFEFIMGYIEDTLIAKKYVTASCANGTALSGVIQDAFGAAPGFIGSAVNTSGVAVRSTVVAEFEADTFYTGANAGWHFLQSVEQASSTTNVAFIGAGQHAVTAYVWA